MREDGLAERTGAKRGCCPKQSAHRLFSGSGSSAFIRGSIPSLNYRRWCPPPPTTCVGGGFDQVVKATKLTGTCRGVYFWKYRKGKEIFRGFTSPKSGHLHSERNFKSL